MSRGVICSHCSFVNNCIGVRNVRYFVSFVFSAGIVAVYTGVASIWYLAWNVLNRPESWWAAKEHAWMLAVSIPLLAFTFWRIAYSCLVSPSTHRRRGLLPRMYVLPGLVGFCMAFVYTGRVVGFEGVVSTPLPLLIGTIALFYAPWCWPAF